MKLPERALATLRRHRTLPTDQQAGSLDAIVVLCAADDPLFWQSLPEASRWRGLHARSKAQALSSRSTSLANTRQTLALLGYTRTAASAFERLTLAGKLMRELASRKPARIGLIVASSCDEPASWVESLLSAAWTESYALPDFRSRGPEPWQLKQIDLYATPVVDARRIGASARAGNLVRTLTAMPPNVLDATAYRRALVQLARRHGLSLRWYSQAQLQRLGAGAFLAVARGNAARDAGIAHLRWRGRAPGARPAPDVALVGKGILFDTGGVNLKPHRSMLDMHIDMSGSAVALASLIALAELRAPINADAWLAISENNIGPSAYRPQEVVRACDGTTIQVIHSDAEGRMVLADTLALAARTRPRLIIDYATLTGSCIYALTDRYSGVFTNRAELGTALTLAGATSGERVWNFPLDDDFDAELESPVADIMQCTLDSKGDHILAARFLKRFVGDDAAWVHVDLAAASRRGGLAHVSTEITGFGVRFTLELLLSQRLHEHLPARKPRRANA